MLQKVLNVDKNSRTPSDIYCLHGVFKRLVTVYMTDLELDLYSGYIMLKVKLTSCVLYSRQIRDTVNWIFCEQMSVCYISVFRDTFWPNGKLAPHVKVRTESERTETKERAQQKLLDNIPG